MSVRDDGSFSRSRAEVAPGLAGSDERVCAALAAHAQVDASQIGVAVDEATGDLILFGSVPSEEQRRLAEACAVSVKGVSVVYNRLAVAPRVERQGNGTELTKPAGTESGVPPLPAE